MRGIANSAERPAAAISQELRHRHVSAHHYTEQQCRALCSSSAFFLVHLRLLIPFQVTMEQFGFDELSEYDQLELLKYMPVKERVRFERINTEWSQLLDRLWLSQSGIHFGMRRDTIVDCHPIGRNDRSLVAVTPVEVMFKIVSKCKNLKAFEVGANSELFDDHNAATQLATVLNANCKMLEHLDIEFLNLAFFELFVPSDKFTCLVPSYYGRWKLLYERNEPAKLMAMKCLGCWIDEIDPRTFGLINKLAVEYLDTELWDDGFTELINLKFLSMMEAETEDIRDFHQLEHIRLSSTTNTALIQFFQNNRKLVSLMLNFEANEVIGKITTLGSNLRKLDLGFSKIAMFNDAQFWLNLAKLTKLRSITLHGEERVSEDPEIDDLVDTKLNVNGLALLLKTCTKLKYFHFDGYSSAEDITTGVEKDQIRKVVAFKSFRQLFEVTFQSAASIFQTRRHVIVIK